MTLILSKAQIALIEREGVEAYPNECCGALLGKDISGSSARRVVSEVRPLRNSFESGEQFHRFSLDARPDGAGKDGDAGGAGGAGILS